MHIADFIAQSNGKFVSVTFIKKDGTARVLNGRTGVTKHLKGGVSTVNTDQYMVLYEDDYPTLRQDLRDALSIEESN